MDMDIYLLSWCARLPQQSASFSVLLCKLFVILSSTLMRLPVLGASRGQPHKSDL